MYTRESIEKIKDTVVLSDLIGSYIQLKRRGASHKACCPFHDEKTPSFTVQDSSKHYHCFGCSAHGDAISFVMEMDKLSFSDAVEKIAQKYNIPLERTSKNYDGSKALLQKRLKYLNQQLISFYTAWLWNTDEGVEAQLYLNKRGFQSNGIERFGIGLSPKDEHVVMGFLKQQCKATNDELIAAGICHKGGRLVFSERLMFPIRHPQGYVVGFSGRKMNENVFGGKYINTTETEIFKKSRLLYGMDICRTEVAKKKEIIIVEGQIDVIKAHEFGFNNVVAPLGTAFTNDHVHDLNILGVERVMLLFDGDKAGIKAALSAGNIIMASGIDVMICLLPDGEDPDTVLSKRGSDGLQEYLNKKQRYLDFLISQCGLKNKDVSPAKKNKVVKEIAKQMSEWKHPLVVFESKKYLSEQLSIPESFINIEPRHTKVPTQPQEKTRLSNKFVIDDSLLHLMFSYSFKYDEIPVLSKLNLSVDLFKRESGRKAFLLYEKLFYNNQKTTITDVLIEAGDELSQYISTLINVKKTPQNILSSKAINVIDTGKAVARGNRSYTS